jgi:hypothetical protein
MIDKVTPSKTIIRGVVERISKKPTIKYPNQGPITNMNKWQRKPQQPSLNVIELGGRKRSSSKDTREISI